MNRILAIDFDGVIHDYKNPVEGKRMGLPIEGTKEALTQLFDEGNEIIVFSVWGNQEDVIGDWMEYYEIPYHSITNIKPNADIYLDDRAIRFEGWDNHKDI